MSGPETYISGPWPTVLKYAALFGCSPSPRPFSWDCCVSHDQAHLKPRTTTWRLDLLKGSPNKENLYMHICILHIYIHLFIYSSIYLFIHLFSHLFMYLFMYIRYLLYIYYFILYIYPHYVLYIYFHCALHIHKCYSLHTYKYVMQSMCTPFLWLPKWIQIFDIGQLPEESPNWCSFKPWLSQTDCRMNDRDLGNGHGPKIPRLLRSANPSNSQRIIMKSSRWLVIDLITGQPHMEAS